MEKHHTSANYGAVLIGRPDDDLVRRCMAVLADRHIDFTTSPDVYAAVACIARRPAGLLIVGKLRELSLEGGRFFDLAARYGHRCCCFADNNATALPHPHTAIASDMPQLLKTLERLLAQRAAAEPEKMEFDKDKFKTSEAELKALLGT
jgi:hypothetical protein